LVNLGSQLPNMFCLQPCDDDVDDVKLVSTASTSPSVALSCPGELRECAPARQGKTVICPQPCKCIGCRWPGWRASLEREFSLSNGVAPSALSGLSGAHALLATASWCQAKQGPDGTWGLGCVACAALPASRTEGTKARQWSAYKACQKVLSRWALRRHAKTKVHKEGGLQLLGVEVGPTGGCVVSTPPLGGFQALLTATGNWATCSKPRTGITSV